MIDGIRAFLPRYPPRAPRGSRPLGSGSLRSGLRVKLSLKRAQAACDVGARTLKQRAVVALDHRHARAHDTGQLEDRHAGGQRIRGEGGAQVIDPRRFADRGGLDRRTPFAAAEVGQVERTPRRAGNTYGESSLGGITSSAAAARVVNGTWRSDR